MLGCLVAGQQAGEIQEGIEQRFFANDHANFHSTMRCLDSSIPLRVVKNQTANVNVYTNPLSTSWMHVLGDLDNMASVGQRLLSQCQSSANHRSSKDTRPWIRTHVNMLRQTLKCVCAFRVRVGVSLSSTETDESTNLSSTLPLYWTFEHTCCSTNIANGWVSFGVCRGVLNASEDIHVDTLVWKFDCQLNGWSPVWKKTVVVTSKYALQIPIPSLEEQQSK